MVPHLAIITSKEVNKMTNTIAVTKTSTQLKAALADTYVLLLKTQNYHWNVTGPHFYNFHQLFQLQYEELFLAVDELAERLRALGYPSPGTFTEFDQLSSINEAKQNINAEAMIDDLYKSNEQMIVTLTKLRDASTAENDDVTLGMASTRIQIHQKAAWMLKASL